MTGEQDKVIDVKVKHKGFFEFKDVYNFLYTLLVDDEYVVEEKRYSEKIKPRGKEIEIEWTASRLISDYFKFVIKVEWFILGYKEEGGKGKGEMKLRFVGFLEKDFEEKWDATPFTKFLREIYDKYVIKRRIEDLQDKVYEEVDELIAQFKSFLAMEGKKEA